MDSAGSHPKSGGSSIECASQGWAAQGFWSNMGHTSVGAVTGCAAKCNVPVAIVVTVREPYKYWQSVFSYSWIGDAAFLTWWLGKYGGMGTEQRRAGPLRSFLHFMRWVEATGCCPWDGPRVQSPDRWPISQSGRLHRACGDPCRYDRLLHTETLTDDWIAMVTDFGLPRVALPRLNEAVGGRTVTPPNMTLTDEIVAIINRVDAPMFSEFGYQKR